MKGENAALEKLGIAMGDDMTSADNRFIWAASLDPSWDDGKIDIVLEQCCQNAVENGCWGYEGERWPKNAKWITVEDVKNDSTYTDIHRQCQDTMPDELTEEQVKYIETHGEFGYIYLITNLINGKQYVGQTSLTIEERWQGHISDALKDGPKSLIDTAIGKYGVENFDVSEIECCPHIERNRKEIYWIKKYDCCVQDSPDKGYNIQRGGGCHDFKTTEYYRLDEEGNIDQVFHSYAEIGRWAIEHGYTTVKRPSNAGALVRYAIITGSTAYTYSWDSNRWSSEEKAIEYQKIKRSQEKSHKRVRDNNGPLTTIKKPRGIRKSDYYDPDKEPPKCPICGNKIDRKSTLCLKCEHKKRRKVEHPPKCILIALIRHYSFVEIGRIYGNVNSNAVKKWCTNADIPTRKSIINAISDEQWYEVAWNYAKYAEYYEKLVPSRSEPINEEEIVSAYKKGEIISDIAKRTHHDDKTISNILKRHNIEFKPSPNAQRIKCIELSLETASMTEMARLLIQMKAVDVSSIRHVRRAIKEAIDANKDYKGLSFENINNI